jgi:hypothetical protein
LNFLGGSWLDSTNMYFVNVGWVTRSDLIHLVQAKLKKVNHTFMMQNLLLSASNLVGFGTVEFIFDVVRSLIGAFRMSVGLHVLFFHNNAFFFIIGAF